MRKKNLEKRMSRLLERKKKLTDKVNASTDVNEVRALTEQLEDVNADIADVQDELDEIEAEERSAEVVADEIRASVPANATLVNGGIVGSYRQQTETTQTRENADPFNTMEYRMAFKNYVQRGEAIPSRLLPANMTQNDLIQRDGMPANTQSLGATIPTTILNEFINEIEDRVYGNLYNKVRKLNVQGGVKIPISKLQAQFKWITETTVSPRQDGGSIDDYVMFEYNIGEIRVSQTLLSSIVTIDLFEREIVKVMVLAYLEAMDYGIVNGNGNGQMLGILNDPRIINNPKCIVEMTAADINNWTAWRKKFFSTLPLSYRAGEFIFPLATVDSYLETMADANNNPVFRQATGLEVNDGDSRNPNGRFFGRSVELVEPNIIADFDSAQSGDVIGVFWQPNQYAINTQMQFGMKRYFDDERNEWVNKMLTIVDGKALNVLGYRIIKKK